MYRSDTTEEAQRVYDQKIRELTEEERFLKGLSLTRLSREMCMAGLCESHPKWESRDLRIAFFERIYGDQYSEQERERIRSYLRSV